jgi:nitrogen fixation/metabolism regulation signal transduction histidine kinase
MLARCIRYFIQDSDEEWFVIENHVATDLTVCLDADLLSVALFNCIKNSLDAYRFAAKEERPPKAIIQVYARACNLQDGEYIDLTVADQAGGIPETIRRRLGTELVSTKGEMGSGLGTRIMLESVGRLGGRTFLSTATTNCKSPPGTCVTFRLPRTLPEELAEDKPLPLTFIDDYDVYRRAVCR